MSDNCCPSNGSSWDTPIPGPTIIFPQGTQVLAEPTAYGCGCGSGSVAVGVTGGAAAAVPTSIHPVLKTSVEVPSTGSNFQINSTGAGLFAIAGMLVWFPPFGYAEITGVTGDLLTMKNLTITLGTVLSAGSNFIATLPPQPVPVVVAPVITQFQAAYVSPRFNVLTQVSTITSPQVVEVDATVIPGYTADTKEVQFYYEGIMSTRALIYVVELKANGDRKLRDYVATRSAPGGDNPFTYASGIFTSKLTSAKKVTLDLARQDLNALGGPAGLESSFNVWAEVLR